MMPVVLLLYGCVLCQLLHGHLMHLLALLHTGMRVEEAYHARGGTVCFFNSHTGQLTGFSSKMKC